MKHLNRYLIILFLFAVPFVFMACPVASKHPLGEKNTEKIDTRLMGTWVQDDPDHEATEVSIKKADDYSYEINVIETGTMFTSDYTTFSGWLTTIEDKKFLVLQALDAGSETDEYYVYHVIPGKGTLTTFDISLKAGGTEAITSVSTYRREVMASMSHDDFLSGETVWTKK